MSTQLNGGQPLIIGVCGICCNVCRLYVSGVCPGCVRGDGYAIEAVVESACSILRCAVIKRVSFCMRDCPEYPCVLFRHGLPVCERYVVVGHYAAPDRTPPTRAQTTSPAPRQESAPWLNEQDVQMHVFCLGPFRVVRNGRTITEAEWGQTKAPTQKVKALFAFLLARGAHGATKDEIVELLWGDQRASEKDDARFHAVLHYLRRALDPGLPPRAESSYVICQDGYYRLAPPGGYWVDAAAFEAYCQHAQWLDEAKQDDVAARYWKLAETLYQGDYMAGLAPCYTEHFVNDCCQHRQYGLKDMHLTALLKLAHHHFRCQEDRLCLAYAQKALAEDRCCEEAHCLIMELKHRAGQYGDLTRQYRLCERLLRETEDRRPSPETFQLYQRLLLARSP